MTYHIVHLFSPQTIQKHKFLKNAHFFFAKVSSLDPELGSTTLDFSVGAILTGVGVPVPSVKGKERPHKLELPRAALPWDPVVMLVVIPSLEFFAGFGKLIVDVVFSAMAEEFNDGKTTISSTFSSMLSALLSLPA